MAEGGWSLERITVTIVVVIVSYVFLSSLLSWKSAPTTESLLADVPVHPVLAEHSKIFQEAKVVKVFFRVFLLHIKWYKPFHPEGGSNDSDICGRYQGFLTSFYNGAYGEILVLTKIK